MKTHILTREEIYKWCSIPKEKLKQNNELKALLIVKPTRSEVMKQIGNMMADEVINHNNKGIPTKWVLPAGPTDEYEYFIERVNKERISLRNLWIFHMDEFLNWEGRPYPVADTYESLEGTMLSCFYGRIDEELNVPKEQRIWPRINNIDYADELCNQMGGIDTVWAGVGATGLIAFNEAPRHFYYRLTVEEYAQGKTRIVDLGDDTMVALAQRSFGCCLDRIPPKAITLGFKVMCSAKRAVYMVATGSWKQTVCRILLFSEPTVEYPVTIFPKYIPECILMTTEETIDHPMAHDTKGW